MDVPSNANPHCPGTKNENAGKASACAGCPNQSACAAGDGRALDPDISLIADRLASVKHKVLILSGKGGVGKSTVAANLARALAFDITKRVAILDIDICGPSQARILGVEGATVHESADGWSPIVVSENLYVMSVAFLIEGRDQAVIWRGARKNALIKQFLKDVDWGSVDYLLVDTPPGTSDEHISVVQFLLQSTSLDGAIVVTTPQEVSLLDVRKEVNFCQKTGVRVLGVVENMSVFTCPHCSTSTELFPATTRGARKLCEQFQLRFLGALPLDPRMARAADEGHNFVEMYPASDAAAAYRTFAEIVATALAASTS